MLSVYDIVTVPALTPLTKPVLYITGATARSVLLHMPPGVRLLSIVSNPWHILSAPRIGVGGVLTFTIAVTKQVVGKV